MTNAIEAPLQSNQRLRGTQAGRRASLILLFCLIGAIVQYKADPSALASSMPRETAITMYSEYGEWVGRGDNYFFYPGNASIDVSGRAEYAGSSLWDNQDRNYSFVFAPPTGDVLQPGDFEGAQSASGFPDPGRPGIDISGYAHGCEATGRFRVNSITTGLNSSLKRLWLVYEQRCPGWIGALFGEMRLNMPGDGGAVIVAPHDIRWPKTDPGHPMKIVPVYVANPTPTATQMGTSRISGADAGEFDIARDDCTGVTLGQDQVCRVYVEFTPSTPGEKQATLTIPEMGGATHSTLLEGYVYTGTTRVTLHSEPGDYIGQGQDYDYTPANAEIWVQGNRKYVRLRIEAYNGDWWDSQFVPPKGELLTPGTTYTATRYYGYDQPGAGMDFRGNVRGCSDLVGKFTVTDISLNRFGEVERFGVDFEQHCSTDWATPPLYGTLRVRAQPKTEPTHSVAVEAWKGGHVVSDLAGIDCGADCTETYANGTSVTLIAVPDPGHTFTGWLGSCAGIGSCVLKATENRRVQAMFSAVKRRSHVVARGRVEPNHAGKSVKVRLKVIRTGALPETVATKTVTLNADSQYSVRFARSTQRRCELTTVFGGDGDHDGSSASVTFVC